MYIHFRKSIFRLFCFVFNSRNRDQATTTGDILISMGTHALIFTSKGEILFIRQWHELPYYNYIALRDLLQVMRLAILNSKRLTQNWLMMRGRKKNESIIIADEVLIHAIQPGVIFIT